MARAPRRQSSARPVRHLPVSKPTPRLLGVAALLVATTSWGGLFLVGKDALQYVGPFWLTVLRYGLGAVAVVPMLLPRGAAPWRRLGQHALPLALYGLAGFGVFGALLFIGLAHSVPSHGAVIMATMPLTTQFVNWLLDGTRPSRAALATTALALVGVAVVSGVAAELFAAHGSAAATGTGFGDALILVGTLGWIGYTRGAAQFTDLDVVEYTALTMVASFPLLLAGAMAATLAGAAVLPTAAELRAATPALLYISVVASAVAVLTFNVGVRTTGAVTATAFLNFVPVSALLMSAALGHLPTAAEVVGTAMVIAALLLHTLFASRAAATPVAAGGTAVAQRAAPPG